MKQKELNSSTTCLSKILCAIFGERVEALEARYNLVEVCKRLGQIVENLDENKRQFITLRFEQWLSLSRIAEKLGVSTSRAKQIEKQLLKELRQPPILEYITTGIDIEKRKKEAQELAKKNLKLLLDKDEYSKIGIQHFGLSTRSYNGLVRHGCKTLGEALILTEEDITKIRNLGEKSVKEIINKLKPYRAE